MLRRLSGLHQSEKYSRDIMHHLHAPPPSPRPCYCERRSALEVLRSRKCLGENDKRVRVLKGAVGGKGRR